MRIIIALLFALMSIGVSAQTAEKVYQDLPLFKDGLVVKNSTGALMADNKSYVHVQVPERGLGLNLRRVDLLAEGFSVKVSKGRRTAKVDGVFYQGTIDGNPNSVATVSVFDGSVVCTYSDSSGNFEIVGDKGRPYRISQIPIERTVSFECLTKDTSYSKPVSAPESPTVVCRAVKIYFEADYKLYQDKGSSVQNTVNYVTSLFNQVAALYANEQIVVQISQIKVWNTPDPYIPYTNTASVLNAFRTNLGTSFNGNLAHLLSTRSLGGGIAYVDVLCFKQYAFGVSAITTTFNNVPTYSWSVEVVTHELGHNMGSWHTHSCNWPGGALDNCYQTEGGCPPGPPPVNGGTVMSYCHLTSYGINFANGFGTVPGNHIRNKFNNASCLNGNSAAPTNLQASNITNTSALLTWASVPGTHVYTLQHKAASGSAWTTVTVGAGTTYTLTGLTPNTSYQWKVKTDCSAYSTTATFTTTGGGGGCGAVLAPTVTNVTQTSAVVLWASVPGVTAYHLQYKALSATNWIEYGYIPTTSLTLSNLTANTVYQVKVRPDCNQNFGAVVQFTTLTGGGTCLPPSNFKITNIGSSTVNLSWTAQAGATGYYIGIKPNSSTSWFTLGPLNHSSVVLGGLQPSTTYNIRLKSNCSDWTAVLTFTTLSNLPEYVVIYPNPSTGVYNIGNIEGKVEVFNAFGTKVGDFEAVGGVLNLENLPNGVYYVRIGGQSHKIVKI